MTAAVEWVAPSIELVPVTLTAAFVGGTVLALTGSLRAPLSKRLGVSADRIGLLAVAVQLALVPMMLLGGWLIDQWGVEWVLIGGSLLTAVAVALLAMSQTYKSALAIMLLLGAAGACIITGSNVLMPRALCPSNPAAALNLGNVFFVLGILLAPVAANLLIGQFQFRRALGLLALCCLAPAAAAALTPARSFPVPTPIETDLAWNDLVLWVGGLCFLLYGPLENVIVTWASDYLAEIGFAERRANWLLSGFWLAFLGARLLTGLVLERGLLPPQADPWLILVLALAAGIALGNLAGATTRPGAAWGILLVGLFLGPIFPTLAGVLFRHFPHEPGIALGTAFSLGALGSLILVPVIGAYGRRSSIRRALQIPAVTALALTGAALVLALLAT